MFQSEPRHPPPPGYRRQTTGMHQTARSPATSRRARRWRARAKVPAVQKAQSQQWRSARRLLAEYISKHARSSRFGSAVTVTLMLLLCRRAHLQHHDGIFSTHFPVSPPWRRTQCWPDAKSSLLVFLFNRNTQQGKFQNPGPKNCRKQSARRARERHHALYPETAHRAVRSNAMPRNGVRKTRPNADSAIFRAADPPTKHGRCEYV